MDWAGIDFGADTGGQFIAPVGGVRARGIDVSHHQAPGSIDWAATGAHFGIARATYGTRPDETCAAHVRDMRLADMRVGVYHFYRQSQPADSQLEAFQRVIDREAELVPGDIAPCLDLEWNEDYDGPVSKMRFNIEAQWIARELQRIYGACFCYYAPGFYQLLGSPAWLSKHPWWACHYGRDLKEPWRPPGAPEWCAWQFATEPYDQNLAKCLPIIRTGAPHAQ